MSVSENSTDEIQLPSKPLGPIKRAILQGGFGIGMSVLLSSLAKKLFHTSTKPDGMMNTALIVGGSLATAGVYEGINESNRYELEVENAKLKHALARKKTFAENIDTEPPPAAKGR